MYKLYLVIILNLMSSWAGAQHPESYWQEYGAAPLVAVSSETTVLPSALSELTSDNKVMLLLNCGDHLSVTSIVEFAKLLLNISEQQLFVIKNTALEFASITQSLGLPNAKEANRMQLLARQRQYPVPNQQASLVLYIALSEFVAESAEPLVHQLVTILFDGEFYNYQSAGIKIDQVFYAKYMQLPNKLQAYTMAYALEKAYKLRLPHWQLSVTNNKLSKLIQLKTALQA